MRSVSALVEALIANWGSGGWDDQSDPNAPHEAALLSLSIDKARALLGWSPRWGFEETVKQTVAWYRAQVEGASEASLASLSLQQLHAYLNAR